MGKLRKKIANFAIQKALEFQEKYLKDRKGKHLNEKYIAEVKKDGLRGIILVVREGDECVVKAYTSNGVRVVNARPICTAIAKILSTAKAWQRTYDDYYKKFYLKDGFVLDGEFFYKDWNTTNSIVMTETKHPLADKLVLHVFDIVPIADWKAKKCFDLDLGDRKRLVSQACGAIGSPKVKSYKYRLFNWIDIIRVTDLLNEAMGEGHEGVMLKRYDGLYKFKKTKDWLKVKPVYTDDLVIVDAEIGTKRNSKRLGALIVAGKIKGKSIKTKVGGGYTDKQREDLWKQHKKGKLVGLTAEVSYDCITSGNAVRFPRFVRLRLDK